MKLKEIRETLLQSVHAKKAKMIFSSKTQEMESKAIHNCHSYSYYAGITWKPGITHPDEKGKTGAILRGKYIQNTLLLYKSEDPFFPVIFIHF